MNLINVDSPTISMLYTFYSVLFVNPIIIIIALIFICAELGAIGLISLVLFFIAVII